MRSVICDHKTSMTPPFIWITFTISLWTLYEYSAILLTWLNWHYWIGAERVWWWHHCFLKSCFLDEMNSVCITDPYFPVYQPKSGLKRDYDMPYWTTPSLMNTNSTRCSLSLTNIWSVRSLTLEASLSVSISSRCLLSVSFMLHRWSLIMLSWSS